jgi:hypothetical protein
MSNVESLMTCMHVWFELQLVTAKKVHACVHVNIQEKHRNRMTKDCFCFLKL